MGATRRAAKIAEVAGEIAAYWWIVTVCMLLHQRQQTMEFYAEAVKGGLLFLVLRSCWRLDGPNAAGFIAAMTALSDFIFYMALNASSHSATGAIISGALAGR